MAKKKRTPVKKAKAAETPTKATTKAKREQRIKTKAKAKTKKGGAPAKATTKKKKTPIVMNDAWLKANAYHGSRPQARREVGKVLDKESKNPAPVDVMKRVLKQFPKAVFTTADNLKGIIFRIRHPENPAIEMRFVTYESYSGKLGVGKPMFEGNKRKTNGIAFSEYTLDGLEDQKNNPNYKWFTANKKNEQQIVRFMKKVGF